MVRYESGDSCRSRLRPRALNQLTQSCPSATTTLFNLSDYRVISAFNDGAAGICVVTVPQTSRQSTRAAASWRDGSIRTGSRGSVTSFEVCQGSGTVSLVDKTRLSSTAWFISSAGRWVRWSMEGLLAGRRRLLGDGRVCDRLDEAPACGFPSDFGPSCVACLDVDPARCLGRGQVGGDELEELGR